MRHLLPSVITGETPIDTVYGDILDRSAERLAGRDRPYVLVNMVASADGAISLDGLSGGLSSAADKAVFFHLRSLADVVLAGASTARAENYGPVKLSDDLRAKRVGRGQPATPRIAVVSRSMKLDWAARLFSGAGPRPYVICPASAPAASREAAAEVADLIMAGEDDVDLADALDQLGSAGAHVVLCEGGPTLNGQLLSAGLVDELCLTVSPALVGGSGPRISGWKDAQPALALELLSVAEEGGVLLLRYAVGVSSAGKSAAQD